MTTDLYAGAATGWAEGASLVYGPIARELVAMLPTPVRGCTVLDAGAGTGVASDALAERGARVVATDLSSDMLRWHASERPPAVLADVGRLPLADGVVDHVAAAFVLNHLTDPHTALTELARVTRPGGSVVACVFNTRSTSAVRDRLDDAARAEGWVPPEWYVSLRAEVLPLLGDAAQMAAAATAAGLTDVQASERPVDVGVTTAEQLVDYRLGQAQFVSWLDQLDRLGPRRTADVRARLVEHIRPVMVPYLPVVVFLSALVPSGPAEESVAASAHRGARHG